MKKKLSLLLAVCFIFSLFVSPLTAEAKTRPVKKWILVGDSRYVQMQRVKGLDKKSDYYVCKGSMGLNWMKTQERRIKRAQTKNAVIVIGMGINDTYQTQRYVEYLKKAEFECPVYFCTINPVDSRKYHGFTNTRVARCNRIIRSGAKKGHYKVIDTYSMLQKKGYDTWDGLHYKADTYKKIYKYIKSSVKASRKK